jgi:serine/threonine protein kinase
MIEAGKILQQRYRIDKQIGQGGMGAVYVATDERFRSVVAIKETLCMDDNCSKAIQQEARLLNRLKHNALPRVSDHFLEEDVQFLVMEYIPGEDLGFMIERNERMFPVEKVLTWADQLLDALDYLHKQETPVIHRDIKPQNLKITPGGQIILLDFGLAKGNPTDAGHQTAAKSIFGYSRNYASLEQIQGTGTDPRSDLYSLAATLYHLATGQPPEDALTRAMSVLSNQADPLVPAHYINSEIPVGFSGVLQNALDLNAAVRPQSASQMRQMLKDYRNYEHLAIVSNNANTVANADISSQRTKLMPGSTRNEIDALTGAKTETLPAYISQETAVRTGSDSMSFVTANSNTGRRPKRAFAFASAAGLLLAGSVAAGVYVFNPGIFSSASGPTSEPQPSSQTIENANASASVPDINSVEIVTTPALEADGGSAKSVDNLAEVDKTTTRQVSKNAKTSTADKKLPAAVDPGDTDIDGKTVYVGNVKIKNGRVETPDAFIDENGITPKVPMVPKVRDIEPPQSSLPPHLRNLTPQQRRKLQMQRRRNKMPPAMSYPQ